LEGSLQIVLSSEKLQYSPQEKLIFTVNTKNASSEPIEVLVRNFDWKDLERIDASYKDRQQNAKNNPSKPNLYPNLADEIRGGGNPRPLGELKCTKLDGADPSARVRLDSDIGGCGTGLKKGLMPAGAVTKTVYTVLPQDMEAWHGVYRFQWCAYRPQGKNRGRVDLSSAKSNILEVRIGK